jgi:hypothetical protein
MAIVTDLDDVRAILERARVIAVLGAHKRASRAGAYVPAYLKANGYRVIPVNPLHAGERMWGEPVRSTLSELDEPIDMVDVFRPSDAIPGHVDDILAMTPLPSVVWLQLGIRHDGAAQQLSAAGIDVVQDRCTLADHRRLGLVTKQV